MHGSEHAAAGVLQHGPAALLQVWIASWLSRLAASLGYVQGVSGVRRLLW
jgi:hypothetical protein